MAANGFRSKCRNIIPDKNRPTVQCNKKINTALVPHKGPTPEQLGYPSTLPLVKPEDESTPNETPVITRVTFY